MSAQLAPIPNNKQHHVAYNDENFHPYSLNSFEVNDMHIWPGKEILNPPHPIISKHIEAPEKEEYEKEDGGHVNEKFKRKKHQ